MFIIKYTCLMDNLAKVVSEGINMPSAHGWLSCIALVRLPLWVIPDFSWCLAAVQNSASLLRCNTATEAAISNPSTSAPLQYCSISAIMVWSFFTASRLRWMPALALHPNLLLLMQGLLADRSGCCSYLLDPRIIVKTSPLVHVATEPTQEQHCTVYPSLPWCEKTRWLVAAICATEGSTRHTGTDRSTVVDI